MRIKRKGQEENTPEIIGTIKKLNSYEDLTVIDQHKEKKVSELPLVKTTNGHSNYTIPPKTNNNNNEVKVYTISNSTMSRMDFQNESKTTETILNGKDDENKILQINTLPLPTTTTTEKYRTRKEYRKLLRKFNDKPKWMSRYNFQACSLALLCGLGTSWRFSAVAIQNHGGTFTFAYLITWLLIGIPVLLLEQLIGQFSNRGPWKVWCIVPLFKGVGLTQCFLSFYFMLIFLSITTWSGIYFSMSCTSEKLPWTEQCHEDTFSFNSSIECLEHFFKSEVLHITDLNKISGLDWKFLMTTVIALILITIICSFGLHLLQFVAPLLAIVEILVFLVILIYASSQEGIVSGVRYFFEPQWQNLLSSRVWYSALTQVIFTQNIGSGIHITLSSYNSFRWSVATMAIVTSFFSMIFGLLTGVTTFGMLGVMTEDIRNTTHLDTSGYDLIFITTSKAVENLYGNCPQVWSLVIFGVFFLVGCATICWHVFNVTTVFSGWFPRLYASPWTIVLPNAVLLLLFGLLFTNGGGIHFVKIFDCYGISVTALVCVVFETIGFLWIYGFSRFNRDIKMIASRSKPSVFLAKFASVAPLLVLAIGIATLIEFPKLTLLPDETFHPWANIFGGILLIVALLPIPITMIYVVSTQIEFGFLGKLRLSISPTMDWGPHQSHYRHAWLTAKINDTSSDIATTTSHDVVLQRQEKFLSSPFNSRSN